MLLEPEEFIKVCKEYGCTKVEFDITTNNVSMKLDLIAHFKQLGQDTYYKLNTQMGLLEVVTRGSRFVNDSDAYYCEVFKTIRYLSH